MPNSSGTKAKIEERQERRRLTKNTDPNKKKPKKKKIHFNVGGFTEKTSLDITAETDQETYKKYNIPKEEQYDEVFNARQQEWMEERRRENLKKKEAADMDITKINKKKIEPVQKFRIYLFLMLKATLVSRFSRTQACLKYLF